MRVAALAVVLTFACSEQPAPPLRFVGGPGLAGFRLTDVQPRTVGLRGGPVTVTFEGRPDAGSMFYVVVGAELSPRFDNIAGGVEPLADGGVGHTQLFLPRTDAGVWDLSLLDPNLAPDAGRLGALLAAIEFRETPGSPFIAQPPSTQGRDLATPLNSALSRPCARLREFRITNSGDRVIDDLSVTVDDGPFTVNGTPGSSPGACGPVLNPESRCDVTVCFESTVLGEHRSVLRARGAGVTATAELKALVTAPSAGLDWQRPIAGAVPLALSASRAGVAIGQTVTFFDGQGADQVVTLPGDERALNLVGDGRGAFVLSINRASGPGLVSFDANGQRQTTISTNAEGLAGIGLGRVAIRTNSTLSALRSDTLQPDPSWSPAASWNVATPAAALADGRLFIATGTEVIALDPTGQLATRHAQPARLLAASPTGDLLVATPTNVLRFTSNAWGFVSAINGPLTDLALSRTGTIFLTALSSTERLGATTSSSLSLVNVKCNEVMCVGTGFDGPDPFIGRVTD